MPERKFAASNQYRYGFNGKENDNELKGNGNVQDYGMRMYDPRLGKFLSVDPLTQSYPWYTPYQFAGNKPIWCVDLDGLEEYYTTNGTLIGKYGTSNEQRIVSDDFVKTQTLKAVQTNISAGTVDDINTNSYALSDAWTDVPDVTGGAALRTYAACGRNCKKAADTQLKDAGVAAVGPSQQITMHADNVLQKRYKKPNLKEEYVKGILAIKESLQNGEPIMVGLTEVTAAEPDGGVLTSKFKNYNVKTQHFVVIVGMGTDANGNYFSYLDNAVSYHDPGEPGADGDNLTENKFYYSPDKLSDDTNVPMSYADITEYRVTEVRKNVKKPTPPAPASTAPATPVPPSGGP